MRYMKKVLAVCIASMILCAIAGGIFQGITGHEMTPTTTPWFYKVFGLELGLSAMVRIFKAIIDGKAERRAEAERQKTERARLKEKAKPTPTPKTVVGFSVTPVTENDESEG